MGEERSQILEMLVAGRLTVEQAAQLLEAVDTVSPRTALESMVSTGASPQFDGPWDDFFASLTVEQMRRLHEHRVSRTFIQEMRAAFRPDLSVSDLIKLTDHDVTPRFVAELIDAGC